MCVAAKDLTKIYDLLLKVKLHIFTLTYASTDISFVQAHGHGGRSLLTK